MKSRYQSYKQHQFCVEGLALARIAKDVGTPFYVYSQSEIEGAFLSYDSAFAKVPHVICYALKANSNLAIGRVLSRLGAGADIVSGGELKRALKSGFSPKQIIFSGVAKTKDELVFAIKKGIRIINVESEEELKCLNAVATELKRQAPFSLRVNPDVRAGGHPHISTGTPDNKFGVFHKQIFPLYQWAAQQRYLQPLGIQCHIGSQITNVVPYKKALEVLLDLVSRLERVGVHLEIIDLGGGLGIDYNNDNPDSPQKLAKILLPGLRQKGLTLFLEPGRSLVAQAGILVTKVLYRKDAGSKHFVMVDAAMNDLARPALYDSYHEIVPLFQRPGKKCQVDVVGPVCESGDYLARNRPMVLPVQDDMLAVLSAGAYGFAMSSQYNSRPRVAEVLVSKNGYQVIRRRETFEDLVRGESIPRELK
ncbi:diaminopimelate decarboxylase [bacterium F11]|nr:diaminopimelate decarboxylase [bacterium F11]